MILCLSIDLDPLRCYRQIYGLPGQDGADPVVERALPRFGEMLRSLGAAGTAFLVGDTLAGSAAGPAREAAAAAAAAGIEIANHTYSHPYRLSDMTEAEILGEIHRGQDALRAAIGHHEPLGFRAPGYNLGRRVLPAAIAAGARYDSSVLPSLSYRGVKAAALAALWLRGRRSRSRLGDVREALAPGAPYRPDPDRPVRRGTAPIVELPIGTLFDLPLVGGLLALLGPRAAAGAALLLRRRAFVHLELHGVDFLDIETDGLDPALGRAQPDLRIRWQKKAEAFAAFIGSLMRTHRVLRLCEAARLA